MSDTPLPSEKLQKVLAHAGYGSRRQLETWISDGRVQVNGKVAPLGTRVSNQDKIVIDGKLVGFEKRKQQPIKLLVYNKPEGEVCTRSDNQNRPTVFENLPALPTGRWVSVGRLDINTSGLLLFTNNGDLANKLMHPSTGLEREYLVRIRGKATDSDIATLTSVGVQLDGKQAVFDRIMPTDQESNGSNNWYKVVIREGRYREVRRMWETMGHPVSRLKRIRYGTIRLTQDIRQGKAGKAAPKQIEKLLQSVGIINEFSEFFQHLSNTRRSGAKPRHKPKR